MIPVILPTIGLGQNWISTCPIFTIRVDTLRRVHNVDPDQPKHAAQTNPDRHFLPPVDFLFQESLLYTSIPLRRNVSARISLRGQRRLIWSIHYAESIMLVFSRTAHTSNTSLLEDPSNLSRFWADVQHDLNLHCSEMPTCTFPHAIPLWSGFTVYRK